jgi:hypothetical protein
MTLQTLVESVLVELKHARLQKLIEIQDFLTAQKTAKGWHDASSPEHGLIVAIEAEIMRRRIFDSLDEWIKELMTRKDFVLIAKAFGRAATQAQLKPEECKTMAISLADSLKSSNINFKHEVFVDACLEACYSVDNVSLVGWEGLSPKRQLVPQRT